MQEPDAHDAKTTRKFGKYTEAKVDVKQEIEQRAQWSVPAWLCSLLCPLSYFLCYIHFSLSVYGFTILFVFATLKREPIHTRRNRH